MNIEHQNKKIEIFNIFVIVYNFLSVLINSINGYVSYISIGILLLNLFVSIMSIKNKGKNISEIICLIIEIVTALIIIFTIF